MEKVCFRKVWTQALILADISLLITAKMKFNMYWDRIASYWKQLKGNAGHQWGKLADGQRGEIGEKRDDLAGKIQESNGVYSNEVERHIAAWHEREKESERFK